jgi:ATP-dependent helicase/nuclease subunit A
MARKAKRIETASLWGDDLFAGLIQQPVTPARREVTRDRKWTQPQFEGISSVGKNLLVSAAAGSGKTAILSERCAHLVCEAPAPYQCDVEELLVVTFTEKAAVEMKSRIIAALRRRADLDPSDRIRRQLALAEQAQVSTLHSFCAKVLRQHFHKVGLDPAFVVMDAEEARLMRTEVAREMFHNRYETDERGHFQRLVDCYADGNDDQLVRHVIRTHEMLRSLVDPDKWLNDTLQRLTEAADSGVESALGGGLVALLRRRLTALQQRVAAAIDLCSRLIGGFPMYVALLSDLLAEVKDWQRLLDDSDLDELARAVEGSSFPKLPSVSNATPDKETAKAAIESVRDEYKEGPWRCTLKFTADEWRDGMSRTLPHARVYLDLVKEFTDLYLQRKEAARQLDFSDLERFTLDVLRDGRREELAPSATARLYHRLFKHVLVDEYQDINELQDAILKLLSHECLPGGNATGHEPNLFCVGDVKQSIYGFRLAEPKRFLKREKRYRDGAATSGQVIDLQANFRSRSPLLEAINGVFKRLMTTESADISYDKSHELTAGQAFPGSGGLPCFSGSPIELHLLPQKLGNGDGDADDSDDDAIPTDLMLERTEREAVFVARRILQVVGLDGSAPMHVMEKEADVLQPRPAQFKDVVILLRSMKYKADEFTRILRRFGIPTYSQNSTGYFDSVEVRDMLSLLALLDNQRQDLPLAAVLRSPLAGLKDAEDALAKVRLRYGSRQKPVTFHEAAGNYAREQNDELARQLRAFLSRLDGWRLTAQRRPLADAIWSIYQETGYLAYVSGLAGGEQRVANLLHLHERASRFGSFQQRGLRRFLDYLESIRSESDLGEPSIASEAENVVRIMTVHGSKGLEFPIVVVPDLGKAINVQDSRGAILVDRRDGLGMSVVDEDRQISYPSLAWTLVQDRRRRQVMAEELRVLYVAMTRAREHLVLVGTCAESAEQKWRDRWQDHGGALPADVVIDARSVLDWLGPVAASATNPCEIIQMTTHPSADVFGWTLPAAGRQATPRLAAAAKREPLDPPAAPDAAAETVISRLSFRYPHEALASRRAVRSVTSAAKADKSKVAAPLPLPAFLRDGGPVLSAADVGTATHLVLQHLDFSGSLDAADIAAQIDGLLENRMLDLGSASRVDREAIRWFLGTEVGRLLRGNASILLRELPVYFKAPPGPVAEAALVPLTALDEVMVRGRLDVFVPLAGGGVIVDYKTDGVDAAAVPQRAEEYRGQVDQYRRAMRTVTGKEVERAWLVFLKPRVLWAM